MVTLALSPLRIRELQKRIWVTMRRALIQGQDELVQDEIALLMLRGKMRSNMLPTKIQRERDQLHRYEGHVDAAPRLGHISARSWGLSGRGADTGGAA
jgi:hypothetical protein